jgi:hypothetical protein
MLPGERALIDPPLTLSEAYCPSPGVPGEVGGVVCDRAAEFHVSTAATATVQTNHDLTRFIE